MPFDNQSYNGNRGPVSNTNYDQKGSNVTYRDSHNYGKTYNTENAHGPVYNGSNHGTVVGNRESVQHFNGKSSKHNFGDNYGTLNQEPVYNGRSESSSSGSSRRRRRSSDEDRHYTSRPAYQANEYAYPPQAAYPAYQQPYTYPNGQYTSQHQQYTAPYYSGDYHGHEGSRRRYCC
ncbi:hypothetical protein DFP72DRAFT_1053985 [Ephemerocybe angulata]|uniref:Uncharacterized protein n=1 Tax=Ephemerocybe angulata TaxID=980116 RepID=A0A8H6HB03_9AGAR|nr:hypothetical protein DFP72DRAFT_1053985 [Tulosesus angulatus]